MHDILNRKDATADELRAALANLPAMDAAEAAVDVLEEERRQALIFGTDAAVAAVEGKITLANRNLQRAAAARDELKRRLADAEAAEAAERERDARVEVAAGLDKSLAAITVAAGALNRTIRKAMGQVDEMVAALPYAALPKDDRGRRTSAQHAVNVLLLEAFENAMPALFHVRDNRKIVERLQLRDGRFGSSAAHFSPAEDFASAVEREIVRPLQAIAASVRGGDAPAELPTAPPEPEPDFEPRAGSMQVFVRSAFFYLVRRGQRQMTTSGVHTIAQPIAEAAIAAGLAVDMATPAGAGAHREYLERRERQGSRVATSTRWEDCAELSFNMDEWEARERDRLRSEWRAQKELAA